MLNSHMFLLHIVLFIVSLYCFIACLYVAGQPCCKSLCLDFIIIIIVILAFWNRAEFVIILSENLEGCLRCN